MKLRNRLSLLFLSALLAQTASAVPAYGKTISYCQPDGTLIEVRLMGDEHCHAFYSLDGQMLQPDADNTLRPVGKVDFATYYAEHTAPHKAPAARRSISIDSDGRTTFPTKGKIKGLILLVEFSDKSFTEDYDRELFDSLANGQNYDFDGATGSIARYFRDQSYGQFEPEFDVVGPVKLTRKLSYYGQNDGAGNDTFAHYMVSEAVQQADTLYNIDFSQYDNDHDGYIDFVYCIYAGYGESYGAPAYTIWPHQSTLEDWSDAVTVDGVKANRYACSCELKYTTGTTLEGIGTFCHEFGHVLGLPDLYQTNGGSGVPYGQWDIMDRGSYNNDSRTPAAYSAYERWCMKWLDLTDLEEPQSNLALPYIGDEPVAYRLVSTTNDHEYFILENRQQRGWDAPQAAAGMMISHVDFQSSSWNANIVNNYSDHYRCAIVPADNDRGASYDGDLFPGPKGKTSFTDETSPSTVLFDGSRLGKPVTGIKMENGIVTFSVLQSKLLPPAITGTDLTETTLTARWDEVRNAQSYTLNVTQLLAQADNPAPLSNDFSAFTEGSYTAAAEETDLADSLDRYMNEAGWTGSHVYDAGGYLQIGKYGVGGTLTTPAIDLSGDGGTYTLKYTVRAYPNRSMNYNLLINDSATATQLVKERFKQTGTPTTVYRVFHNGTAKTSFSLTTTNERLFVDELKVARGAVDSLAMDTLRTPQWVITDITDTQYTLGNLTPGGTYRYYVQAISGDVLYDSSPSETVTVTLPGGTSAISGLPAATTNVVEVYSLAGQKLYCGPARTLPTLRRGIYIVRTGGTTRKIVLGE